MKKLKTFNVKVGGFYQDIEQFGENEIYHLCQVNLKGDKLQYALLGLKDHNRYLEPCTDINKVFGNNHNGFVQVTGNLIIKATP